MITSRLSSKRGFTLIELMVVIALVSVILTVVAPSFTGMLARKRIEGVAAELGTDLQYARSEAVQRNAPVRVIFGSNCYAIHVIDPANAATNCTTLGAAAVELKTVQISTGTTLAFTPATVGTLFVEFEPVRATAADAAGADSSGYVNVNSSAGNWELRVVVTRFGRMKTCSPNASITGHSNDCS